MALPALVREAASQLKTRLEQALGPDFVELRVFGSRARGEARAESDLDLFVMLREDRPELTERVVALAYGVYSDLALPYAISPYVVSQAHFELLVARERLLAHEILSHGVKL